MGRSIHTYPQVLSASTIVGDEVKNVEGDSLGNIKEIMLDLQHGRIAYAVLSFGGFLGFGDKLFALPWSALRLDAADKCFILDVPKETLDVANGFDKNDWPDFADPAFHTRTYETYGFEPYWT